MKINWSWKIILFPAIVGMICFGNGLWIHGKALLAQVLLQRAWAQTQVRGESVKPWPWADTWPVARLRTEKYNQDLIVLAGQSGQALAFGPGMLEVGGKPGQ
ncbi:class GN sortase, partial [Desulfobulbus sp. US5]|nr:class GN sortase [Desulfobulbus sp. US5]